MPALAVMLGSLCEALKLAGADGASVKKAAEDVARYDDRVADLKTDVVGVRGEFHTVKWMLGFNVAITLALVGKAFLSSHRDVDTRS